jgi:hypothetical protein
MTRPDPKQALAEARCWKWQAVLGGIVGGWLAVMLLWVVG